MSATAPTKHIEPYSSMSVDMARAFLATTARPTRRAAAAIAQVVFVAESIARQRIFYIFYFDFSNKLI